MMDTGALMPAFATEVYKVELAGTVAETLITRLDRACRRFALDDLEGQNFSKRVGYLGYTSLKSIPDLAERDEAFAELREVVEHQAGLFAKCTQFQLGDRKLRVNRLWISLIGPNGARSSQIHVGSVLSGTLYTTVPENSGALKFEDPRLGMMMHAPPRLPSARLYRQTYLPVIPQRGTLLLWESWLRQEVTANLSTHPSVSIGFNIDAED